MSLLLLTSLAVFSVSAAERLDRETVEYRIKAAYILKFGDYVEWPELSFDTPSSPLIIGVIAGGPLSGSLTNIVENREVKGRKVEVQTLSPDSITIDVHVLFVGRSGSEHLPAILAQLHGRPVLTVTETDGSLVDGSIINFVLLEDKVRFDIGLVAADRSRLKISSRLIEVARDVVGGSP